MNVLFMVSWYSPPAEKISAGGFHYDQAMSLKKYCNCAIYHPYARTIEEPFTKSIDWGMLTYRSKYKLEDKLKNRLYMYRAMKFIVQDFKPDIIHANVATECGRFAIILGKIFHIPVMISEHSTIEASGVSSFPHYYYAKFAYGQSMYNTCVSDSLTNGLKKIFPMYDFHTVYNGIKDDIQPDTSKNYRKDGCLNIGFVASFYDKKIKGMQYLLPALKKCKKEGLRFTLHIIGDGLYLDHFKKMARELGISDECVFYGRCDKQEVYDILNQMDFFVSASIFESFSCVVAESLMLGIPALVTKSGGPECMINGQNGILVEKGSEKALFEGIKEMSQRLSQYKSEEIAKDARERFAIDQISEQYYEIYKKILRERKQKKRR